MTLDLLSLGLSEAQLAERKKGLGGGDAANLSRKLWLQLTGRADPDDLSDVLAVQLGSYTEPFNCAWYEKITGREVTNRGQAVVSKRYPWMRANLDGITKTSKGYDAYVDFKHTGRADDAMVRRYMPQLHHCCIILGLDHWVLSVLIGNSRFEVFEGECDVFYREELIARERDFWGYVTRDEDPGDRFEEKPAVPAPQPKLREIMVPMGDAYGDERLALLRRENWLSEVFDEVRTFASTHAAAALHAITREKLKSIVPEDVGRIDMGKFTFKRDRRGITLSLAKEQDNG